MKKTIHPTLHDVTATCTCGAEIKTRSTVKDISTTLCSHCHPIFTGTQKLVDTAGRIEKFNKKFAAKPVVKKTPAKKAESKEESKTVKKAVIEKTSKK